MGGSFSPVRYLFHRIEEINHSQYRFEAGQGPYAGRQGVYNAKTLSYFYPEYIDAWKDKGLIFHSTEMGGICWTAMVPEAVRNGLNRTPKVLVILCDVDFSDPNWSIHVLTRYDAQVQKAAEQGFAALFINMDNVSMNDTPFGIMQEFSVIYNILMDEVLLDVSHLRETGVKLSDIDGFVYTDEDGSIVSDPDSCIFLFNDVPVLDISHRWQNRYGGCMDVNALWIQHPKFDREKFIHSEQGRLLAEGLRLEHDFDFGDDPEFLKYWDARGVEVASHDHNNYQWISCAPKACLKQPTIVVTSLAESRNDRLHCRQDDERFSSAARAYQRRQKAQNCPVSSVEEILAVSDSTDPILSEIEYLLDDVWVEYHAGSPAYIGELINNEGKRHYRLAILTNQAHFISPQMPEVSWEFMRRFANDPETGRTVELY